MHKKVAKTQVSLFDPADYLRSKNARNRYLEVALEENGESGLEIARKNVARAEKKWERSRKDYLLLQKKSQKPEIPTIKITHISSYEELISSDLKESLDEISFQKPPKKITTT